MKRAYKPEAYAKKLFQQKQWYYKNKSRRVNGKYIKKETPIFEVASNDKSPRPSLFEILNILRKDNKHYLWDHKPIIKWNGYDWNEFNKLKMA